MVFLSANFLREKGPVMESSPMAFPARLLRAGLGNYDNFHVGTPKEPQEAKV